MATCSGCCADSKDLLDYNDDNPVEDDGTFSDGKFVCNECYCRLIDLREGNFKPDIGNARQIQQNARILIAGQREERL